MLAFGGGFHILPLTTTGSRIGVGSTVFLGGTTTLFELELLIFMIGAPPM